MVMMLPSIFSIRAARAAMALALATAVVACGGDGSNPGADDTALASPAVAASAPNAQNAPNSSGTSSGTPSGGATSNAGPTAITGSPGGPVVFFADVEAGPAQGGPGNAGVPIAIFGKGFGAQRGSSMVTIGGAEIARYLIWGENNASNGALDMIVVQPGAGVTASGPVVVTVSGKGSNTEIGFAPTGGKIYFVAPTGSDSAACTEAQPCATIQHVATMVMQAGDALLVRGGALTDNEIWIRDALGHSGVQGRPKVIRNYPGEKPTFTRADRPVILDANHLVFSGFHFEGGKSLGVGTPGLRGYRVVNNSFRGTISWDAIGTHGDDIVLAGNVCDVSASTVGTQGHCYYISHGRDITLRYNVARGAPGYGIHIFDQRRSTADFRRVIANVLVEGNLLAGSPERSGMIIAMSDEGALGNHIDGVVVRNNLFVANNFAGIAIGGIVRNVQIHHNTFYKNGRQGITIYDEATVSGIDVRNNLIDQSANANCKVNCTWYEIAHVQRGAKAQNVTVASNFYAPGPATLIGAQDAASNAGESGFVNGDALDFHLKEGAAPVNRGAALPAVLRDFDGRPRAANGTNDPGAFERP